VGAGSLSGCRIPEWVPDPGRSTGQPYEAGRGNVSWTGEAWRCGGRGTADTTRGGGTFASGLSIYPAHHLALVTPTNLERSPRHQCLTPPRCQWSQPSQLMLCLRSTSPGNSHACHVSDAILVMHFGDATRGTPSQLQPHPHECRAALPAQVRWCRE
jgi:hypothetical protein